MTRDDSVYLRHILDAIAKIETYLQGVSESGFQAQSLIQDGTIRQIEVIGEAVRHLSRQLRNDHSEVPWADIAGMRSKLIHDYFGVDVATVWLTAKNDLPELRDHIQRILESRQSSGS